MLKTLPRSVAAIAIGCTLLSAANWLTFGGDPQRTGWAKDETAITPNSVKSLQLDWKLKVDNQSKELNSLLPAVTMDGVITPHGFREYVIVAGSSDNLYAIDADSGKLAWQKHFTNEVPPPHTPPFWLCPQALNDTPVIAAQKFTSRTVYVISIDGKLHALNINNGEDRFTPTQFVPPYSKNWSLNLVGNTLYTSISQGCGGAKSGVWAMDLSSPDKKTSFFQSDVAGGGIWGRGGPTIGPDGTVYVETGDGPWDPAQGNYGNSFLALSGGTLKLVDYFTPVDQKWINRRDLDMGNITPVVFPYKGRELIVGAGKQGILYMLDAKSLGGQTHRDPLYKSPLLANEDIDFAGRGFWGAFATWQDPQGTRWVYAPAWGPVDSKAPAFPVTNGPTPNGSIMAFKVEDDKDGKPVLTPAWISRDMNVPEPPVVANGVVFAVSSGEFVRQAKDSGALYTSKERAEKAVGNATLYAFDAATGKELYSSGKTMPSFSHFGGLAVSNGRVYVSTYDSTIYAFGVKTPE